MNRLQHISMLQPVHYRTQICDGRPSGSSLFLSGQHQHYADYGNDGSCVSGPSIPFIFGFVDFQGPDVDHFFLCRYRNAADNNHGDAKDNEDNS